MMLALRNAHPRDARIQFIDTERTLPNGRTYEEHYYVIDGIEYRNCSVSTLQKDYFPNTFDAVKASRGNVELQQKWETENRETVYFGKMHHTHFENYFNGLPFQPNPRYPDITSYETVPGWAYFQEFLAQLPEYWEPFRTEWFIFSKEASLPGAIDLTLRDRRYPDKLVLAVCDYKVKKEPTKLPWCECGHWGALTAAEHHETCPAVGAKPASRHILRRKCDVDAVQVCLYARILEDLYDATVTDRIIIYLHPNYPLYIHHVDAKEYDILVDDMVNSRVKPTSDS